MIWHGVPSREGDTLIAHCATQCRMACLLLVLILRHSVDVCGLIGGKRLFHILTILLTLLGGKDEVEEPMQCTFHA